MPQKKIGSCTSGLKVFSSLKTYVMLNLFFPICEDRKVVWLLSGNLMPNSSVK